MPSKLEDQLRALAEAQKATWAAKWPVERISATELGCDTRHMVQVGVTDDGEPIGECDGGLEPAAEGEKSVMDFLERALGFDFPALLAEFQRLKQQLANVTRERDELVADKCATWGEKLCAQLAAAQASEALLRGALEWYKERVGMCARFDAVPGGTEARADLAKDIGRRAHTALATQPSDAVKRIMAMERVCEAASKVQRTHQANCDASDRALTTDARSDFLLADRASKEYAQAVLELDCALRALTTTKEHGDDA